MTRVAFALVALALFLVPVSAGAPKAPGDKPFKPLVFGDNADEKLAKEKPDNGVIASQKGWENLVKAWAIKDAPKVNFDNDLLFVVTTVGSGAAATFKLDDKGDLKVQVIATADIKPGFRYFVYSHPRKGVKTVNGKDLPKE
jgi:hypothetical protein